MGRQLTNLLTPIFKDMVCIVNLIDLVWVNSDEDRASVGLKMRYRDSCYEYRALFAEKVLLRAKKLSNQKKSKSFPTIFGE